MPWLAYIARTRRKQQYEPYPVLEPNRFEYSPIIDRPIIKWPNNARVALWVAPNLEHYEYMPGVVGGRDPWPRTPQPDVREYAVRDYGNRVGFWRMLKVMDKHKIRCTVSLNVAVLHHFEEIRMAMVERDWEYMWHGVYNTRNLMPDTPEAVERVLLQDGIRTVKQYTGKELKGLMGPNISATDNTLDIMAELGMQYFCNWFHDDQPFPLKVRKGRLISLPYSVEVNDLPGVLAQGHDSAYMCQQIKDQFETLYEQGARNGRVMCISLHPFFIGQPSRIKHLEEALDYVMAHDGVWSTTANDICDYYMMHYYEAVVAHLEERKKERL